MNGVVPRQRPVVALGRRAGVERGAEESGEVAHIVRGDGFVERDAEVAVRRTRGG